MSTGRTASIFLRSLIIGLTTVSLAYAEGAPTKIIIDADPGVDDSMAILLALHSPALEVVGITTVFGNTSLENGTANALTLVDLVGAQIPVARGAERPTVREPRQPPAYVHGSDGLGEVGKQRPVGSVIDRTAAEFIVDMARKHPGEITLVPVGPLTNIALALDLEPRLPELVREIVLMGGAATVSGNVTPAAEANIYGDPHAADRVFSAPWKVTMVGLDVTTKVRLKDELLARLATANPKIGGFIWEITRFYKRFYESTGVTGGFYVHDPSAVAYVIDPDLFETRAARVRVDSDGLGTGQTIAAFGSLRQYWTPWVEAPETQVCVGVDAAAMLRLFESTLTP